MAVELTIKSAKVAIKVNDGTTTTGAIKTATISLPTLDKAQFTAANLNASAQKAANIVNAVGTIIDRSAVSIELTLTDELSEE